MKLCSHPNDLAASLLWSRYLKKKKIPVMSNSVQLSMMTTNIESVTVMLKRRKDRVKNGLPDLGEDLGQAVTRVTG